MRSENLTIVPGGHRTESEMSGLAPALALDDPFCFRGGDSVHS